MDPNILAALLLIGAIVLVVAELFLPTGGILGVMSILAFIGYIFVGYKAGFTSPVDILLIISGLVLLFIESTIAGFGIVGITGLVLLLLGLVGSAQNSQTGMVTVIAGLIIATGLSFLLFHFGYSSKLSGKSVLKAELKAKEGYVAGPDLHTYLGSRGVAETILRPTGFANFNGDLVEVKSQSGFISKGSQLEVCRIENGRLVVKEVGKE